MKSGLSKTSFLVILSNALSPTIPKVLFLNKTLPRAATLKASVFRFEMFECVTWNKVGCSMINPSERTVLKLQLFIVKLWYTLKLENALLGTKSAATPFKSNISVPNFLNAYTPKLRIVEFFITIFSVWSKFEKASGWISSNVTPSKMISLIFPEKA
ncbi:unnamed protein product [Acanthoscelides obtectus]|uniref:Uncharacterized protein n=1 Tax=Acanthoscelides obtectus TaxID=200917 RepID=A0A9P0LNR0_ACAOB|nr:unnamed protein product [Acanthoscelides obtectus]CAK1659489.1 hypothetical protein AOBTE_LOCUS21479 [Acanthoscelides obtectus]